MQTIIEPFKIKMVEALKFTTPEQRANLIQKADYNLFNLKSEDILIDLLTDSGTTAMSAKQWAGVIDGDEAYAGSRSYYRFEQKVQELTGLKHIIPTHQGRAAEKILFSQVGKKGDFIPNNTHFDTTRANIEYAGLNAIDLPIDIGTRPEIYGDFKGNIDIQKLAEFIEEKGAENIPLCMITVTNNSGGGQPVSMQNIRETKELLKKYNIPLFLDACRFAENAYFIKLREQGYENKSVKDIAQEMFSYCDGATMSAKKDAMVNTGGFLAMNSDNLALKSRNVLIVTEGFTTYGGLARRDLEAIAQGLDEVLDENYLEYRIKSTGYLGNKLTELGIPILVPPGGHAIYIDAKRFAPQIEPKELPGQAIACELYKVGGIRSVEIGSLMFGKDDENGEHIAPSMELVRLAIPRRVYTQSHIDYVIEVVEEVFINRENLRGLSILWQPEYLRHFSAKLALK